MADRAKFNTRVEELSAAERAGLVPAVGGVVASEKVQPFRDDAHIAHVHRSTEGVEAAAKPRNAIAVVVLMTLEPNMATLLKFISVATCT